MRVPFFHNLEVNKIRQIMRLRTIFKNAFLLKKETRSGLSEDAKKSGVRALTMVAASSP